MTIASWHKETRVSEINTMVRLGNGASRNFRTNYDPFSIEPFVISLRIGQDERIVEFNEQGELVVDGEIAIVLTEEG